MRIIKYIFILFFLFSLGTIVYIATQNAQFSVSGSKYIRFSRSTVFSYIDDYKNWQYFASWNNKNNPLHFSFPSKYNMTWKGANQGSLKTTYVKKNDSIVQKMLLNGQSSEVKWKFKDTIGGTKIYWKSNGKYDFYTKVLAFFKGGVSNSATSVIDETLYNINKELNNELTYFNVKDNGVVPREGTYYIKRTLNTLNKNLFKNIKVVVPKLYKYIDDNNLNATGKPFVIYNKYSQDSEIIGVSICLPVRDSINIMPGGEIASGKTENHFAVKTTITGDYAHTKKAWNKAFIHIAKNRLIRDYTQRISEVYIKNHLQTSRRSEYITEVYIPVYKKVAPRKRIIKPTNTPAITTPAVEAPSNTEPSSVAPSQ